MSLLGEEGGRVGLERALDLWGHPQWKVHELQAREMLGDSCSKMGGGGEALASSCPWSWAGSLFSLPVLALLISVCDLICSAAVNEKMSGSLFLQMVSLVAGQRSSTLRGSADAAGRGVLITPLLVPWQLSVALLG